MLCARTGSYRQFERTRNLRKRCLLCFAHPDAADAKKSTLLGCLGDVLADLAQPALESRCIPGRPCRSVSMHLALISAGLLPVNFSLRPSRAMLRPSAVSKSATTALISASDPGSILAVSSALPLAKLSFKRPTGRWVRPPNALQKKLPFVGCEVRLVRHGLTPKLVCWRLLQSTTVPVVDDRGWRLLFLLCPAALSSFWLLLLLRSGALGSWR